jgi:hypothetical protein
VPRHLQHQGDPFERKMSFHCCDIRVNLDVHGLLSISPARRQRPIRMPTATSTAKIARTITTISSVAMTLLLDEHLAVTCLSRLQARVVPAVSAYLSAAAASVRGWTLLPSTRFTGGVRIS